MNRFTFFRMSKSFAAIATCLAANTAFAELVQVETKVVQLLPRDWGLSVRMESAAVLLLQSRGVNCIDNSVPVLELSKPNYKTMKDSLLLAYALNKKVTIFIEKNPAPADSPVCLGGCAPKIYAIDVLEN